MKNLCWIYTYFDSVLKFTPKWLLCSYISEQSLPTSWHHSIISPFFTCFIPCYSDLHLFIWFFIQDHCCCSWFAGIFWLPNQISFSITCILASSLLSLSQGFIKSFSDLNIIFSTKRILSQTWPSYSFRLYQLFIFFRAFRSQDCVSIIFFLVKSFQSFCLSLRSSDDRIAAESSIITFIYPDSSGFCLSISDQVEYLWFSRLFSCNPTTNFWFFSHFRPICHSKCWSPLVVCSASLFCQNLIHFERDISELIL